MTDLDDAGRLRRRKRLLGATAPVVLATAVLAVKLLSLPLSAGQAMDAFADGDGGRTLSAGKAMGTMNVVERYKAHFALGDGHVLAGDFGQARSEFARALELAPSGQSCKVRVNLVLSLEKLGGQQAEAGDPASAAELYAEGARLVAEAPRGCFAPNSPDNAQGEGEALKQAAERLAEKQDGGPEQDPGQPDADDGGEADEAPPADKLEQLEKSGQQAQKERSEGQKLKEALDAEEPGQYGKPW